MYIFTIIYKMKQVPPKLVRLHKKKKKKKPNNFPESAEGECTKTILTEIVIFRNTFELYK